MLGPSDCNYDYLMALFVTERMYVGLLVLQQNLAKPQTLPSNNVQCIDRYNVIVFTLLALLCFAGVLLILQFSVYCRLDPALIRPGRVDMKVAIGYATSYQVEQMYLRFYPEQSVARARLFAERVTGQDKPVSMAQLQGYFMFNKNEPEDSLNNISQIWTL